MTKRTNREIQLELLKQAYKEATKEWLDEQFAKFGRWSFFGVLCSGLTALVYFILWMNGFQR